MKSVTQILGDLTGESHDDLDYGSLSIKYASAIKNQSEIDERLAQDNFNRPGGSLRDRQAASKNSGQSMIARRRAKQTREAEARELDSHMPIATMFETYQSAKQALAIEKRDVGLSVMASHLEKLWKKDRTASINAYDFAKLQDHYSRNYPKSSAASVLEGVAESGYSDLPKKDLMQIAASIHSQEDYDYMMKQHGLTSNSPRNKKARGFILSLLSEGN